MHATHAIYDPQTARLPEPFAANGSTATRLALVMNEHELRRYAGCSDLAAAAAGVIAQGNQDTVVIVKRGVRGVTVYESNAAPAHVPAYYSSRVFKIGSGDVFTAIFAHQWGEAGLSALAAADFASRSVAAYCETMRLPVEIELVNSRAPLMGKAPSRIVLNGSVSTIGRRYTLEEARFRLKELGLDVLSPPIDGETAPANIEHASSVIIADGLSQTDIREMCARHPYANLIVLDEEGRFHVDTFSDVGAKIIPDFTSALYHAAWPPGSF
ncbi:carbohydrate kinase family protein [Tistrella sp. BH-R2-4]|uniref:Carbohydrate kinase family protein n=2 Tax=Alphaproteobacteria TaxID=28211 RepID=A0ABU9YQ93_9PROT